MKRSYLLLSVLVRIILTTLFLSGCKTGSNKEINQVLIEPVIDPDYSGVTVPPNIAPMNFNILQSGESFKIDVTSSNGTEVRLRSRDKSVRFSIKNWKKLLAGSEGGTIKIEIISKMTSRKVDIYKPIYLKVARERIDPFLCYRTLFPGYESWGEMKIIQRSLEDFREASLVENQLLEDNCINCHSFSQNNPDKFLIHVRGSKAGTYFVDNKNVIRRELKLKNMPGNAVYPAWNPAGKYIAFSSNKIYSVIHMRPEKNIELYDKSSILILYNIERNEMSVCREKDLAEYMVTYPFWSPDGKYLYFCRAKKVQPGFDLTQIKYDLAGMSFNQETGLFGKPEVIIDSNVINKSVSFPSVSPNGQYLIFTLQDYGTFPNWHNEADLYLFDLNEGKMARMALNSSDTESYHSWSANGSWLVFSTKRGDGLTSRPYIAYFFNSDSIGKPFIMPQKDPGIYARFTKSFNRPEFSTGKIKVGPREFTRASKKESIKTIWGENKE